MSSPQNIVEKSPEILHLAPFTWSWNWIILNMRMMIPWQCERFFLTWLSSMCICLYSFWFSSASRFLSFSLRSSWDLKNNFLFFLASSAKSTVILWSEAVFLFFSSCLSFFLFLIFFSFVLFTKGSFPIEKATKLGNLAFISGFFLHVKNLDWVVHDVRRCQPGSSLWKL